MSGIEYALIASLALSRPLPGPPRPLPPREISRFVDRQHEVAISMTCSDETLIYVVDYGRTFGFTTFEHGCR
jgi:hypothetical protein